MISELMKRGTKLDGPTTTMLRERATSSHRFAGGGRVAMYSAVWRERVVKRLQ